MVDCTLTTALICTTSSAPANYLQDGGACVEVPARCSTRYLADLCVPAHSVHGRQQLPSTVSGNLLVPRARTATGQHSFANRHQWNHEYGTVCQPILEHQIRPSAPSSVISRPTCFSSSLRCCWQVGTAPFVRRRCDCLASSAPFTNIQTYLLTYLPIPR